MVGDQQQFKRNIAYKLRIGDLLLGKPMFDQDKFTFLELGDKRIVRVNLVGNIVDRFGNDGEKKYQFLTLDDGSGQIKLKSFGDDAEKLKDIIQGQTVVVIGVLRHFNNEVYVSPEIVKEQDPRYLLIRKLEIENERKQVAPPANKDQIVALKDRLLDLIKNADGDGGIDTDKIILTIRDASPEIINQEIQKMIEEGIVFEPRPGRVRWLG